MAQELDRVTLVGDLPEHVVAGVEPVDIGRERRVQRHRWYGHEGDLADMATLLFRYRPQDRHEEIGMVDGQFFQVRLVVARRPAEPFSRRRQVHSHEPLMKSR